MNDVHIGEMLVRTTASFFSILILARVIGKKQLSQLTFFHYVTGITIGSVAAEIAAQVETPFFDGLISLIWWSLLTIFVTFVTTKSKHARLLFDGKPTVLMKNGQLNRKALKKERLHMDELTMLLREQNIFSLNEVDFITLETNGEIGVRKKSDSMGAAMALAIPTEVISDGQIIYENLDELGITENWLIEQLKKQNIDSYDNVFFAQLLEDGTLYISPK